MDHDSVLAPLADRYAHWLGLDAAQVVLDREEAAQDIRAMQLVLRMERTTPPSWHRAVALAAGVAAAICLDARGEPGGEWHDAVAGYVRGHIRKVTRRARGAHWAAVQELPGITVADAGTQVRALVPGPVAELDPRVGRLQVGGTDVSPDEPPAPAVSSDSVPSADECGMLRLWVPTGLPMTVGKAMAQAGHAGMICAALLGRDGPAGRTRLDAWRDAGYPVRVRRVDATEWVELGEPLRRDQASAWTERSLLAVRDAGFTEVAPGTVTVLARAPGG
jgi:peptidyl-tRNA hydrolase